MSANFPGGGEVIFGRQSMVPNFMFLFFYYSYFAHFVLNFALFFVTLQQFIFFLLFVVSFFEIFSKYHS